MPSATRRTYPWGPMPYASVPADLQCRSNVNVSVNDRNLILATSLHDGIFTLIVQQAYVNAANFIRDNNITNADPRPLYAYLLHGTDPRAAGDAASRAEPRAADGGDEKSPRGKKQQRRVSSKAGR